MVDTYWICPGRSSTSQSLSFGCISEHGSMNLFLGYSHVWSRFRFPCIGLIRPLWEITFRLLAYALQFAYALRLSYRVTAFVVRIWSVRHPSHSAVSDRFENISAIFTGGVFPDRTIGNVYDIDLHVRLLDLLFLNLFDSKRLQTFLYIVKDHGFWLLTVY